MTRQFRLSGGEIGKIAAIFAFFTAFFCSFGLFSLRADGDALAFVSSLPIFLSGAAIVTTCVTLIRMDADEDEAAHGHA